MAKTDLETLVVRMEAQMRSFENELKRGRQTADRETRAIERRFADTNKKLSSSFAGLGAGLQRGLGALGLGLGGAQLAKFADQFTNIQNALRVTGLEGEKLNQVYGQLFASAQKNAAPLQSLVQLYGRVSLVQGELGVTSEQIIGFADRISLALRVSGQSSEQASGALLQLSQALGAGVVRAEEFNSILEGAPTIVQAVARGIEEAGGSVGKLRQLVVDGKVSSKAFFDAFLIGSGNLETSAAKMNGTIGQELQRLQNAFVDAVGKINGVTGASGLASAAIIDLNRSLQWISDNVEKIKGPYDQIATAIRGIANESESAVGWMRLIDRFNPAGRIGREVGKRIAGVDRTSPALPPVTGGGEWAGPPAMVSRPDVYPDESRRGLAAARLNAPPISIDDARYRVAPKKEKAEREKLDPFERAVVSAEKRIEVERAETAAINDGVAARERAKLVAELEVAAIAANKEAKLESTAVTVEQNAKIQETADKMYQVASAAEAANAPMARAARAALDWNDNLQNLSVGIVDDLAQSIQDVATGAKTASEAFREMAASILRDLGQMIIKAALYRAISGFAGMGGGSGAGFTGSAVGAGGLNTLSFGGPRAGGGPVSPGKAYLVGEKGPEIFAPNMPGAIIANGKGGGGGPSISYAPMIDARGADVAAVAKLEQVVARDRTEFESRVKAIVQGRGSKRW